MKYLKGYERHIFGAIYGCSAALELILYHPFRTAGLKALTDRSTKNSLDSMGVLWAFESKDANKNSTYLDQLNILCTV